MIDLKSGEAVGLHFAGRFLESNFAVPATLINQRLSQIKNKVVHQITSAEASGKSGITRKSLTSNQNSQTNTFNQDRAIQPNYDLIIPLRITVSIGNPVNKTGTEDILLKEASALDES